MVNAWGVVDAKLAATSAAREAARSFVEASSDGGAVAAAEDAGKSAIEAHGRRPERAEVRVDVDGGRFARCARATAEVRYDVPLIAIPLLGQAGSGITVTARHSELIDPYRGGLPGTAACNG